MSKLVLNIKGRHIEKLIKKLHANNIIMYSIKKISDNEANITIKKEDYEKFNNIKTIYEATIIDAYGLIRVKAKIKINKLLIIFIVISLITIKVLTNMIFNINVIYNDNNMRKLILSELESRGIKKYTFKKSFKEIQKIKQDILDNYKDKIEWLEIEELGTNYIVRLEERKINEIKEETPKRHVIAKKDAIIKKIEAQNGQIVKEINSYVKKGDIIISGNISLNDEIKTTVSATGDVYGEVWYKVKVTYPLHYYEEKVFGKKKKRINISFLNYNLFNYDNNKKIVDTKNIYYHNFIPFKIELQTIQNKQIIDEIYTIDEAINVARKKGMDEINSKLNVNEQIVDTRNLKVNIKDSKIELDMFIVVYENIAEYLVVEE